MASVMRTLSLLSMLLVAAGCGGDSSPTAPSQPAPPPAQVGGSWSGTLESNNYQPLAVFVSLNQTTTTCDWYVGRADGVERDRREHQWHR